MCGIWAILQKFPSLNVYLNNINLIKSRGPDNTSIFINNNMIVAFNRLAIQDLSNLGNQPFTYSNNNYNYLLIINGEIYNYKELQLEYNIETISNSDCEFILKLFIILNEDINSLNNILLGEYAFLIIKENYVSNVIQYWMSVDPFSVRPLFYSFNNNNIYISSLVAGLSSITTNIERLNQGSFIQGTTDLLNFNYYSNNKYYIKSLPYYNTENNLLYKKIVKILTRSVNIRLNSDKSFGCLLSGGLDSSLIAAIAAKELEKTNSQLKTFSIGMKGGTDLIYAKKVAKHINSIHTEFIFTKDEGINIIDDVIKCTETYDITTIRASVGHFLLAKKISETTDIKVLLNGDGADECQMGYLYFYLHPNINEAYKERNKLLDQIHYFDGLRVDRNISYHGMEARLPYLDKNFVDLYNEIFPELLIPTNDRMEKFLIRKAFDTIEPDLLPNDILWRKKEAFSDGISSEKDSWFEILSKYYNNIDKITELNNLSIPNEYYYYKMKFKEYYGNNEHLIPGYWMPNWSKTKDPSARTLNISSIS